MTAILYTRQQFRDITKSPSWAAAAYDGRIRIPVLGALKDPAELDRVVTHEFVHAVIHQMYPRVPGLAERRAGHLSRTRSITRGWWQRCGGRGDDSAGAARPRRSTRSDGNDAVARLRAELCRRAHPGRAARREFSGFLQYLSNGTPIDQALLLFNINACGHRSASGAHGPAVR